VSSAWIYKLVAAGVLSPFAQTIGGISLFDMSEVEALRAQRRTQRLRRRRQRPVAVNS
jgi:hypothetical protein